MNKIEVDDNYIDTVLTYFNLLLNLKPGTNPSNCEMCVAADQLVESELLYRCEVCPLATNFTGICCLNRQQLKDKIGNSVFTYSSATPESIQKRVEWMIKQVNEHTVSDWIIYLK